MSKNELPCQYWMSLAAGLVAAFVLLLCAGTSVTFLFDRLEGNPWVQSREWWEVFSLGTAGAGSIFAGFTVIMRKQISLSIRISLLLIFLSVGFAVLFVYRCINFFSVWG